MSGYARIHRTMLGHPAFRTDAEALAFGWMIIRAAWRPTRVRYKDRIINLKRGQLAVSQRDMARSMDRDKAWCARLIQRLKSEAMIEVRTEAGVSLITICSYEKYQGDTQKREAVDEAPREAADEAGARQGRGTEQEREEDNNNRNAGARLLPDGWEPLEFGAKTQSRAIVDGWSRQERERQIEGFIAHHRSKRSKFIAWQDAWSTWVLNSVKFERSIRRGDDRSSKDFDLVEHINANPERWRGSG